MHEPHLQPQPHKWSPQPPPNPRLRAETTAHEQQTPRWAIPTMSTLTGCHDSLYQVSIVEFCYYISFPSSLYDYSLSLTTAEMPFIPHTPESLIPRSDSKNPAATCRGLTSSGRLCRRAIAPSVSPPRARLSLKSPSNEDLSADAFCWQHKDQAAIAQGQAANVLRNSTIRERTSVDTLIDRLGLLEIKPEKTAVKQRRKSTQPRPILFAAGTHYPEKQEYTTPNKAVRNPRKQHNVTLLCCVGVADEDLVAPRPAQKRNQTSRKSGTQAFQPMAQLPRPSQPPKQNRPPRPSTGSR
jgi:hypothetical protein